MPKGNKEGPPEGSKGPHDGYGKGEGNAPGKGIGTQKGGKRNIDKDKTNKGESNKAIRLKE